MIVDCAHYRDGRRQHEGSMSPEDAAAICRSEPGFVWAGMVEPSPEELAQMQETFGLHELAVEDAQSFHLRPKIEQYESDVSFVVLRTARYVDEREEIEFGEISVFISPSFVITVRQGAASDLHGARLRLEQRPALLEEGSGAVLWAILDKVVDDYAPVVEGLEVDIEEVERTVFGGAAAPTERIYSLRREASDFYRAVHPLLGPLDAIERGVYQRIGPGLAHFFRDVNDHLKLVHEEVSVEQTEISVRQNETSKQLTLIATIFLPLTFITGFFGQNFAWMVRHISSAWAFVVYGVGSLVISGLILYWWFRRRAYFR
jgi:magnesium transporter